MKDAQEANEQPQARKSRRLAVLMWGLVAAIVVLTLFFFDVTPADLAYQVSRCLRCH